MPTLLTPRPNPLLLRGARIQSFQAPTLTECLLLARRGLGPDAEILTQRKFKKGAWFGRWGGIEWMEVTCRLAPDMAAASATTTGSSLASSASTQFQTLETRLADLTASVQGLVESSKKPAFQPAPVTGAVEPKPAARRESGRRAAAVVPPPSEEVYPDLLRQLLDAEIAAPLARQWVADLPPDLSPPDARSEMRTLLAQRLQIDARPPVSPRDKMQLLAFMGTTGVGKTTTIAKIAARYALVERRRVGIITLDTYRIAAAQQLQAYGEALHVPVRVAADKSDLLEHLAEFAADGMEVVLLDTTGRSPNEMIPLGETAYVFEGVGSVQKYLILPATLSARDMDNIVTRFRHALSPDALILTKLDEATDSACFGKLLTVQAKHGLPLAYVTTGQKVPDDIAVPDAHAIAARIVSSALF
jgi:flagellar biosynthesis protein FlhF